MRDISRVQYYDYLLIDEFYSSEQKAIREIVRNWVKQEVMPKIEDYFEKCYFPREWITQMGELGILGCYIPQEYGGGGLDYITYGLIMQELERGDSGVRSAASVQTSLVMFPIWKYGSEEHKRKYLPELAKGKMVGCFGLTEPDYGSNPKGMKTKFVYDGDYIILNGSKMWITNAQICDIAVVWAKDPDGIIRGIIVERDTRGFETPEIKGKLSLRASHTGELVFTDARIPKKNILPGVSGLKGPLSCLTEARYGIGWGAIGSAVDCYDTALQYSLQRIQFNKPIAGFQLTQKKLAEMLTEIVKGQLLALRVGQLKNEGKVNFAQISMLKRNNVQMALEVARTSRQILGAMGITSEFPIMRHMMNLESVITYEGTHEIHLLITGEDITKISAFE